LETAFSIVQAMLYTYLFSILEGVIHNTIEEFYEKLSELNFDELSLNRIYLDQHTSGFVKAICKTLLLKDKISGNHAAFFQNLAFEARSNVNEIKTGNNLMHLLELKILNEYIGLNTNPKKMDGLNTLKDNRNGLIHGKIDFGTFGTSISNKDLKETELIIMKLSIRAIIDTEKFLNQINSKLPSFTTSSFSLPPLGEAF
jgi:hypothetical protein